MNDHSPISLALGALTLFVATVAAAHVVFSDVTPTQHMVSEYANRSGGWFVTAGFAFWATSLLLTALGLRWAPLRAMVALAAVGAVLVCVFKTQAVAGDLPAGVPQSVAGRTHDLGGELLIAGLASASLLLAVTPRVATWELRRAAIALLTVGVGLTAGLLAAGDPWPGLRQRALITVGVALEYVLIRAAAKASDHRRGRGSAATGPRHGLRRSL